MMDLRKSLIKLASEKPDLRKLLVPLLVQAARVPETDATHKQASDIQPALDAIAKDLWESIRLGSNHRVEQIYVQREEIEILGLSNLTYKWGSYGELNSKAPKGAEKDLSVFMAELPAAVLRALGTNAASFTITTQYGDKNYLFVVLKAKPGKIKPLLKASKQREDLRKELDKLPDTVGVPPDVLSLTSLKAVNLDKMERKEQAEKVATKAYGVYRKLETQKAKLDRTSKDFMVVSHWLSVLYNVSNKADSLAFYLD